MTHSDSSQHAHTHDHSCSGHHSHAHAHAGSQLGDLLGSVAAIIAGLVIAWSGWLLIDPILSLLICVFILNSSLRLLAESIQTVLEAVPAHLDVADIGQAMAAAPRVHSVHDLHVWRVSSETVALTAHVVVSDLQHWPDILPALQHMLLEEFAIDHPTLQPECQIITLQPAATLK